MNAGYDINNVNDIVELIVLGDMEQSPVYNVRAEDEFDEQSRVPEAIRGPRQFNTATSEAPSGFNMPEGGFTPTDMSALETASAAPINDAQRVALAGGNLDEAIALRSNAGSGLASLRTGVA